MGSASLPFQFIFLSFCFFFLSSHGPQTSTSLAPSNSLFISTPRLEISTHAHVQAQSKKITPKDLKTPHMRTCKHRAKRSNHLSDLFSHDVRHARPPSYENDGNFNGDLWLAEPREWWPFKVKVERDFWLIRRDDIGTTALSGTRVLIPRGGKSLYTEDFFTFFFLVTNGVAAKFRPNVYDFHIWYMYVCIYIYEHKCMFVYMYMVWLPLNNCKRNQKIK